MVFKSFLLVNLVSVSMKITNSVVMVGLYYGFISAFSMGSSYLFLLRPRFLEKDPDAIEKKVSETAGFFTGQFLVFISILYVPLHLALGKPHTIFLLAGPYFFVHFLSNNSDQDADLFALEFTNAIRNLRILWLFLNNLLFQLFSLSLLARPMLTRLSHIYIFRCNNNNKILFVLSSFVGWLIGHILILKWFGLVFFWILRFIRSKRMKYITSNVIIPSTKYIREKWRNSFVPGLIREILSRKEVESVLVRIKNSKELDDALWWIRSSSLVNDIKFTLRFYLKLLLRGFENRFMRLKFIDDMEHLFTIVLFATFLFYLDRTPLTFPDPGDKIIGMRKKVLRAIEAEQLEVLEKEMEALEEEMQEREEKSPEEPSSPSLLSEERRDPKEIEKTDENLEFAMLKDKNLFPLGKPTITYFFDPQKSLRPLRYIKTGAGVEEAVKNETSQYFFYTCQSDGKERICFTYPPSLAAFWKMLQKRLWERALTKVKRMTVPVPPIFDVWRALRWYDPTYTEWTSSNEEKKNSLSTEFKSRIQTLDKKRNLLNVLARRKRSSLRNVLETRKRSCRYSNSKTKHNEYLIDIFDPFVTGADRLGYLMFTEKLLEFRFEIPENMRKMLWLRKNTPRKVFNKLHELMIPLIVYYRFYKKLGRDLKHTVIKYKSKSPLFKSHQISKIRDPEGMRFLIEFAILDRTWRHVPRTRLDLYRQSKCLARRELAKKVPRWKYKLIDELEQVEGTAEGEKMFADHDLRILPFKRVAVFTEKEAKNPNQAVVDDFGNYMRKRKTYAVRFLGQMSDFRRGLIKGSPRQDRRKAYVCRILQVNPRSPLFNLFPRSIFYFFFKIAMQVKVFVETRILNKGKKVEKHWLTVILNNSKELRKMSRWRPRDKSDEDLEDDIRIENVMEMWENIDYGQAVRALILLLQIFLRKKVVFPALIIGKNLVRMLLLQDTEWKIDFARLQRERYSICTYNGMRVSEILAFNRLPQNWTEEGLQIQVTKPFSLKPWHTFKTRSIQKDPKKLEGNRVLRFLKKKKGPKKLERDRGVRFLKKKKGPKKFDGNRVLRFLKKEKGPKKFDGDRGVRFLTSFGILTDRPFGDLISPDWGRFFKPIGKELTRRILQFEKKHSLILSKRFLNVLKTTKNWVIKSFLFLKRELSKRHIIALSVVRESSESTLSQKDIENLKNEQDFRMSSNPKISESLLQGPVRDLKDDSLPEKKVADPEKELSHLDNELREVWDHIDKVTKERKQIVFTPEPDSPNKLVQAKKKILKKLQRIKTRPHKFYFLRIRKSYYILLFFIKRISRNIKRIYLNLLQGAISIRKIHPLIFFEFSKKISEKSIGKTEPNKEKVYKTKKKKNPFIWKKKKKKNPFISIFKESLYDKDSRISKNDIKLRNIWASKKTKKSKGHSDLSSVSQAYVFYKLYQTQLINLDKLRYVLQYHGTSRFLKKELKEYFEAQELFHSKLKHQKLKHKNILNSGKNQWKSWLKAQYQYSVSPIIWNSLSPQKWRTKVNQQRMDENTDLNKRYSNKKREKFFHKKREKFFKANKKKANKKNVFVFGTYLDQKARDIKNSLKSYSYDLFSYQSINSEDKSVLPLCINKKQKISYNRRKANLFNSPEGIALSNNFLVQNDLLDLYTFPDRKYVHWRLFPGGLIGGNEKEGSRLKRWTASNSGDAVKYWTAANGNTSIKPGVLVNWENYNVTKNENPRFFDWCAMNTKIPNNCISDLKGWFFPDLMKLDLRYQVGPWSLPTNLLFENEHPNRIQDPPMENHFRRIQKKNDNGIQNLIDICVENQKINKNKNLEKPNKQMVENSDKQMVENPDKQMVENPDKQMVENQKENKGKKNKGKKNKGPGTLKPSTPFTQHTIRKRPFVHYIRSGDIRSVQVRLPEDEDEDDDYDRFDRLKVNAYELNKLKIIKEAKRKKKSLLTSIKRGRLKMEFSNTFKSLQEVVFNSRLFGIEPLRLSRQNKDGQFLIYQLIKISLVEQIDPYDHNESFELTEKYRARRKFFVPKTNAETIHKSDSDLFVPETILSTKRRRELRILISFYSRNGNLIYKNPVFCKYVKNCGEVVDNSEKKKKKLIKSFLWPNYRLEDLACMNRYWFNAHNGSRFSMLRIHMYPRLKIR